MKRNFKKIVTVFALCAVSAFAAMASGCSMVDSLKEKIESAKAEKEFIQELEDAKELEMLCLGTGVYSVADSTFSKNEKSPWYFFNVINSTGFDELILKVKTDTLTAKVDYSDEERCAFVFYDVAGMQGYEGETLVYDVLQEIDDCSYVSIDVTEIEELCFAVDEQSSETVEAWLR